ncbi:MULTISPECIES: hypothetical protein [Nostoc]|uniref:Uncharacterized protein n=1 Tax=Nostoc paludosum FACHB-159 TaxID=2692908 RepID=A0ABR8KNT3_9NOSO|nr:MULTISPECIES: hypothetical protein [Nostoc]MBD2683178.1 hypothetical protein [Nostoc sp. FACHB-857]MBD2739523.1 hypothetical protein [Nostoc paludosum FACHB-159]
MTQPNILESTRQKLKKFHWPLWFPYPSSWLKALILALFLRVIIFVIDSTSKVGYRIAYFVNSLELFVMFTILLILSPIIIISFTHHCLHLLLSRFISEIQAPEIGKTQGFFPGIMSWWEGLYAWLVIVISTLIAIFFCTIFLPSSNITYSQSLEYYGNFHNKIIGIFGFFYIFAAALVYQIEYLVRQRIIFAYSSNKKTDTNKYNTELKIDEKINQSPVEMDVNKIKKYILSNHKETKNNNNRSSLRNFNKHLILVVLICLVPVLIYISSEVLEIFPLSFKNQPETPSKTVLVTPSPLTSEPPNVLLKTDTFREAVNKAIKAANLTQLAKSPDEWKTVVSEWEEAIALMKNVPSSSPNYTIAQQKIIEYQKNLNYAQKNTVSNK